MKKRNSLIFAVSLSILFFIGYYISATFIHKPLSDNQLDYYEEIALNVFEKTVGNVTIETDEVVVRKTPSDIIVSPKYGYVGFVKATLNNDDLVFSRVSGAGTVTSIILNCLLGIIFAICLPILFFIICTILFVVISAIYEILIFKRKGDPS